MKRRKLVAGNWKMNMAPSEAKSYASKYPRLLKRDMEVNIIIFPQSILLPILIDEFKNSGIKLGSQNCHWELQGAFTGETSPQTLKQLGIEYCLVGHSERRHTFGETNVQTGMKVRTLHQLGMTPIICVGETVGERERGQTEDILRTQIDSALKDADPKKTIIVAYEPVWAIGTGRVATPDIAQKAHAVLREYLKQRGLQNTTILYGGSVKPDNVATLVSCPDIDGFLVGGASLEPEEFANICLLTLNASR